jgi:hypothetical protein
MPRFDMPPVNGGKGSAPDDDIKPHAPYNDRVLVTQNSD